MDEKYTNMLIKYLENKNMIYSRYASFISLDSVLEYLKLRGDTSFLSYNKVTNIIALELQIEDLTKLSLEAKKEIKKMKISKYGLFLTKEQKRSLII